MSNKVPNFGKDTVLYIRRLADAKTKKGGRLAYQIEHTLNRERSTDTIDTKDGAIVNSSPIVTTIDVQAVSTHDELNADLMTAFENDELLEIWEVDLKAEGTEPNTYKSKYMLGKLGSWSLPASVDGTRDISTTITVEKGPVDGDVTLTAEQQEELALVFRDLSIDTTPSP